MFFKKKIPARDFGALLAFQEGRAFQTAMWKATNIIEGLTVEPASFDPENCNFHYAKFGCAWIMGQAEAFARKTNDPKGDQVIAGANSSVAEFAEKFSVTPFHQKIESDIVSAIRRDLENGDFWGIVGLIIRESWGGITFDNEAALTMMKVDFDTSHRRQLYVYKSARLV